MLYIVHYVLSKIFYIIYEILFEGVCGSKRTVLMARARISRFGPRVHVPISFTGFTGFTAPTSALYPLACQFLGVKTSLGVERECNRQKKVAYVLYFRASKSIWLESGDNRFCVFAYLTALLRGHFLILAYLTWFLRGRFSMFSRNTITLSILQGALPNHAPSIDPRI